MFRARPANYYSYSRRPPAIRIVLVERSRRNRWPVQYLDAERPRTVQTDLTAGCVGQLITARAVKTASSKTVSREIPYVIRTGPSALAAVNEPAGRVWRVRPRNTPKTTFVPDGVNNLRTTRK